MADREKNGIRLLVGLGLGLAVVAGVAGATATSGVAGAAVAGGVAGGSVPSGGVAGGSVQPDDREI